MQSVVGIFTSRAAAEQATEQLGGRRTSPEIKSIFWFLAPRLISLSRCPRARRNSRAWGQPWGVSVGGAIGASRGMMTATVLSALVPGIGTVTAIGLAALSLLGLVGGAVAGAAAGGALEDTLANGLPKDEIMSIKYGCRRGRTVLIAFLRKTLSKLPRTRAALEQAGAESLDAARAQWWVGMRDAAEAEAYQATVGISPGMRTCIDADLKLLSVLK